jgi:hypothetical protein
MKIMGSRQEAKEYLDGPKLTATSVERVLASNEVHIPRAVDRHILLRQKLEKETKGGSKQAKGKAGSLAFYEREGEGRCTPPNAISNWTFAVKLSLRVGLTGVWAKTAATRARTSRTKNERMGWKKMKGLLADSVPLQSAMRMSFASTAPSSV